MDSDTAAATPSSTDHRGPQWLASANASTLGDFLSRGYKLWTATLGPKDMLYVPCGFVTTHKVQAGGTNMIGLRVGVVSKCDESVLKDLAASHSKAGKISLIVNQSIDFVTAVGTAVVASD